MSKLLDLLLKYLAVYTVYNAEGEDEAGGGVGVCVDLHPGVPRHARHARRCPRLLRYHRHRESNSHTYYAAE